MELCQQNRWVTQQYENGSDIKSSVLWGLGLTRCERSGSHEVACPSRFPIVPQQANKETMLDRILEAVEEMSTAAFIPWSVVACLWLFQLPVVAPTLSNTGELIKAITGCDGDGGNEAKRLVKPKPDKWWSLTCGVCAGRRLSA